MADPEVQPNPEATAQQRATEERLQQMQGQLQGVQQALGGLTQHLNQQQAQVTEAQLAEMQPADRAEYRAKVAQQETMNLRQQIAYKAQQDQERSAREYAARRSQEILGQHSAGLDKPLKFEDVPEKYQGSEASFEAYVDAEAKRRRQEAEAAKARQETEAQTNDQKTQERRELAAAGAGPAGARPAPPVGSVGEGDYQRVATQLVDRRSRVGQQGLVQELKSIRDAAFAAAGRNP